MILSVLLSDARIPTVVLSLTSRLTVVISRIDPLVEIGDLSGAKKPLELRRLRGSSEGSTGPFTAAERKTSPIRAFAGRKSFK